MSGLPKVGDCFQDRYEILSILGSGGFGFVYKARQLDYDRLVALKVPHLATDSSFYARFLREAKALSRICHLNVVTVYRYDITQDDLPFLAMEFIEGIDVRKLLNNNGSLPVLRALMITKQCADALAYVHEKGIDHRDLKPENIILVDKPEPDTVKLVDFGLARLSNEKTITAPGSLLGTVDYISPELAAGKKTDHRSDQYSLCVCLYEMLCGQTPFKSDSPIEVMSQHIYSPVPELTPYQLDYFHPDVNKVISRAMAKEPENRFKDMTEFSQSLTGLIETIKSSGTAGRLRQRDPAFKKPSAILLVLSIAAIVLFLGVKFFHIGPGQQPQKVVKKTDNGRTILPDRNKRINCSHIKTIEDMIHATDKKKALAALDECLSSDRLDSDARALLLADKISFCPPEEALNYAKQAYQLAEREYQLCHRGTNDDLSTWVYVTCASIYLERLLALGKYGEATDIIDRLLPVSRDVGDFNSARVSRLLRTTRAGDLQVWAAAAAVGMHDYRTANQRMDTLRSYQGDYANIGLNATILLKLNRDKDVSQLSDRLSQVHSEDADGIYSLDFVQKQRFTHFQEIMEIAESCRMASRYDLAEQCLKRAEKILAILEESKSADPSSFDDTNANLAVVEMTLARIGLQLSEAKNIQAKKAVLDIYTKWSELTVTVFKHGGRDYPRLCAINLALYLLECGATQEADQLLAEITPDASFYDEPSVQISGETSDLESRLAKFPNDKSVRTFIKALHSHN